MKTKHLDEAFVCQHCHISVAKRGGGYCRNHCTECLYSLHVDDQLPGDRLSTCHGLMKPIDLIYNTRKVTYQLVQECVQCKYTFHVAVAKDDNQKVIMALAKECAERKMMQI